MFINYICTQQVNDLTWLCKDIKQVFFIPKKMSRGNKTSNVKNTLRVDSKCNKDKVKKSKFIDLETKNDDFTSYITTEKIHLLS